MDKLKTKMRLLLTIAIVGITLMTIVTGFKEYHDIVYARKTQLQWAVQSAYNTVLGYKQKESEGSMSREEAQLAAKSAIRYARYGGKDGKTEYYYIFENTTSGVTVMHPINPAWEGVKKVNEIKNTKGDYVISDMLTQLQRTKSGETFVDTFFPRPGKTEAVAKIQYVMNIDGWNWIIGSGLYMDDINSLVYESLKSTLFTGALVLVVIILVGVYLVKNVIAQIGGEPIDAIAVMQKVAAGDLTVNINTTHKKSLMAELESMVKSLSNLVRQTQMSTQEIASASNEISQGNMDLSVRTEETAASLQSTAASIDQISKSVAASHENTAKAKSLTHEANAAASNGGQVMSQVINNMGEIKNSSTKINDITSVIDSIAFQTNLLALNAAVEAARAGEQGRGFAVVATEVRNLAARSATAAKEIKQLITSSSQTVQNGVNLATKAQQSMDAIVQSVDKVTTIITEINASTAEQKQAADEINTTVNQLDSMTQQNAALVEEAAAAASSMSAQAQNLEQLVEKFKV